MLASMRATHILIVSLVLAGCGEDGSTSDAATEIPADPPREEAFDPCATYPLPVGSIWWKQTASNPKEDGNGNSEMAWYYR